MGANSHCILLKAQCFRFQKKHDIPLDSAAFYKKITHVCRFSKNASVILRHQPMNIFIFWYFPLNIRIMLSADQCFPNSLVSCTIDRFTSKLSGNLVNLVVYSLISHCTATGNVLFYVTYAVVLHYRWCDNYHYLWKWPMQGDVNYMGQTLTQQIILSPILDKISICGELKLIALNENLTVSKWLWMYSWVMRNVLKMTD